MVKYLYYRAGHSQKVFEIAIHENQSKVSMFFSSRHETVHSSLNRCTILFNAQISKSDVHSTTGIFFFYQQ
jgi:hypothetical protein